MSEDGNSYSIKSMVDPELSIDLTCTRLGPGFKIGKDGKSLYGTDPAEPWGAIRHIFWPRNKLTGFMVVAEKGEPVKIDFSGTTMLVMALQAMKPHHAGMSIGGIWGIKWSLILSDIFSCQVELCQFPGADYVRRHDGVHYPTFIWEFEGECFRHRNRWGAHRCICSWYR